MSEELSRLWAQLGQTVVFLADRAVVLGRAPHGIDSEHRIELPRPRRHLLPAPILAAATTLNTALAWAQAKPRPLRVGWVFALATPPR